MLVALMFIIGVAAVTYIVYRKSKKYKASIVRIGLTFMQFQLYASFVHIEWPVQMRTLFTMQETIATATPSWVSFDCFTMALGLVREPDEGLVASPALEQTTYQVAGIPTLLLGIAFCFFCCRYVYLHLTNGKKADVISKNDDGTFEV